MGKRDMEEAHGRGRQERYIGGVTRYVGETHRGGAGEAHRARYKIRGRGTQGEVQDTWEGHTGGAGEAHRGRNKIRGRGTQGEVQDTWEGHTGEVHRGRYEGGGM